MTTAAGLWSAAGVGLALGVGFYEAAVAGTVAVFAVITLLQKMDNNMHRKTKTLEIYVELEKNYALGDFLRDVRAKEIEIRDTMREHDAETEEGTRAYVSTLKLKTRQHHLEVIDELRTLKGIICIEEL